MFTSNIFSYVIAAQWWMFVNKIYIDIWLENTKLSAEHILIFKYIQRLSSSGRHVGADPEGILGGLGTRRPSTTPTGPHQKPQFPCRGIVLLRCQITMGKLGESRGVLLIDIQLYTKHISSDHTTLHTEKVHGKTTTSIRCSNYDDCICLAFV